MFDYNTGTFVILNNSQFFSKLEKNIKNYEINENKMLKVKIFRKINYNNMHILDFFEIIK